MKKAVSVEPEEEKEMVPVVRRYYGRSKRLDGSDSSGADGKSSGSDDGASENEKGGKRRNGYAVDAMFGSRSIHQTDRELISGPATIRRLEGVTRHRRLRVGRCETAAAKSVKCFL